MLEIDMDDDSWAANADPAWADRPSLHEMQLKDSLELGYEVAAKRIVQRTAAGKKARQAQTIHQIVTRAIASMVPVDEVTNRELARILLGDGEQDSKTSMRHFRNDERPLKSSTANTHIQQLLHFKKITPSEGGRLWYVVLLHETGMNVVAELIRQNGFIDQDRFQENLDTLIAAATERFDFTLGTSLNKSSKLSLAGNALSGIRQFMDYCAFVHWQESKIKRNPLVSIKRLIDLAPLFDEYTFDE